VSGRYSFSCIAAASGNLREASFLWKRISVSDACSGLMLWRCTSRWCCSRLFSPSFCLYSDRLLALSVRLSTCLSVTLCIVPLRVGVGGWKLYRRVHSRWLPFHSFRHFCWRMCRSATTHSARLSLVTKVVRNPAAEIKLFDIWSVVAPKKSKMDSQWEERGKSVKGIRKTWWRKVP